MRCDEMRWCRQRGTDAAGSTEDGRCKMEDGRWMPGQASEAGEAGEDSLIQYGTYRTVLYSTVPDGERPAPPPRQLHPQPSFYLQFQERARRLHGIRHPPGGESLRRETGDGRDGTVGDGTTYCTVQDCLYIRSTPHTEEFIWERSGAPWLGGRGDGVCRMGFSAFDCDLYSTAVRTLYSAVQYRPVQSPSSSSRTGAGAVDAELAVRPSCEYESVV
jgi:hypothetical protein